MSEEILTGCLGKCALPLGVAESASPLPKLLTFGWCVVCTVSLTYQTLTEFLKGAAQKTTIFKMICGAPVIDLQSVTSLRFFSFHLGTLDTKT